MKNVLTKSAVLTTVVLLLLPVLFSFNAPWGGDIVRVYLNDQMVMEQYLYKKESVKEVDLSQAAPADRLSVVYSHCGSMGTHRSLTLRNQQDKLLKKWTYADKGQYLTCSVNDLLRLSKPNQPVRVYYQSNELPEGKWVATLRAPGIAVSP